MSYWTGSKWVDDDPPRHSPEPTRILSGRERRIRHVLGAITEGALLSLLIVGLLAGTTLAGKSKGGPNTAATAGCTVDGSTVTGSGLPTDQVLNFFVTDASGKHGWVLGWTDTGTWAEGVDPRNGPTTYEFASRTWGPNGSKYTVFAACSAG